MTYVI